MSIRAYDDRVPRAPTTADVFNAVAEPRRREILDVLKVGELPVSNLVATLRLGQPQVSKHLRVLREVGVVAVRSDGRRRLYRLNPLALRPVVEWVAGYADLWSARFAEMDVILEELEEGRSDEAGRREKGDDHRVGGH